MRMAEADDRETNLSDPPIGRISTTCNQHVHHSIGALCYHNLMQHHCRFITPRDRTLHICIMYELLQGAGCYNTTPNLLCAARDIS
jgi:hypothetical protein